MARRGEGETILIITPTLILPPAYRQAGLKGEESFFESEILFPSS
jgi:hypothetical protein